MPRRCLGKTGSANASIDTRRPGQHAALKVDLAALAATLKADEWYAALKVDLAALAATLKADEWHAA